MESLISLATSGNFDAVLKTHDPEQLAAADCRGSNLYHHAAIRNRVDVVEHLIQFASTTSLDQFDETLWRPIHYAFFYGNDDLAAWLRRKGASLGPAGLPTSPIQCEQLARNGSSNPVLLHEKMEATLTKKGKEPDPFKI